MAKLKLKTNRGAAKRFKKTANGIKHKQSFRNHILTSKSVKRKRHLRSAKLLHPSDQKLVEQMLPYI